MNTDELLKQLENNNTQFLQNYLDTVEKYKLCSITDNFLWALADFIEHNKFIDPEYLKTLEESLVLIYKHKEKIFPYYSKKLDNIKNSDETQYYNNLILFIYSVFNTEYLFKYQAIFLIQLLKENLSSQEYTACKKIIFDEYFDYVKELCLFDEVSKMPSFDNKNSLFNHTIQTYIENFSKCYWKDESLALFLDIVNTDLKDREFYFKDKIYTFKSIAIETYNNNKKMIKITKVSINEGNSLFPLDKISWKELLE